MKIRLTLGNILGVITGVVGVLISNDALQGVPADLGGQIAIIGGAILAVSKGIFSKNTDKVPDEDKIVDTAKLVIQKTLVK